MDLALMDWSAAVTELVAVVVGILVALWVNDWNRRRLARREEAAYLTSLRDDFATDVDKLRVRVGFAEGTADAATELLRTLRRQRSTEVEPNALLRLLKRVGMVYPFQPTRTTFQELSGGGNLGVIHDRSLLRAVIEYYDATEFAVASSDLAIRRIWFEYYDALSQVIDPALIPTMTSDVFELLRMGTLVLPPDESRSRQLPDSGVPTASVDVTRLSGSSEFDRAVSLVLDSAVLVREGHRDLLARAESVLELLERASLPAKGSR